MAPRSNRAPSDHAALLGEVQIFQGGSNISEIFGPGGPAFWGVQILRDRTMSMGAAHSPDHTFQAKRELGVWSGDGNHDPLPKHDRYQGLIYSFGEEGMQLP